MMIESDNWIDDILELLHIESENMKTNTISQLYSMIQTNDL